MSGRPSLVVALGVAVALSCSPAAAQHSSVNWDAMLKHVQQVEAIPDAQCAMRNLWISEVGGPFFV
jgi:hypothetical protein